MTKYIYTMDFTANKLVKLIEDTIGLTGSAGASGNRNISITFKDTDATPAQRQEMLDAIPEFMRLMYSFERTTAPDDEE